MIEMILVGLVTTLYIYIKETQIENKKVGFDILSDRMQV